MGIENFYSKHNINNKDLGNTRKEAILLVFCLNYNNRKIDVVNNFLIIGWLLKKKVYTFVNNVKLYTHYLQATEKYQPSSERASCNLNGLFPQLSKTVSTLMILEL